MMIISTIAITTTTTTPLLRPPPSSTPFFPIRVLIGVLFLRFESGAAWAARAHRQRPARFEETQHGSAEYAKWADAKGCADALEVAGAIDKVVLLGAGTKLPFIPLASQIFYCHFLRFFTLIFS
jgi:hypothetical protein